jgi:farnesyl-diphosphate farnesyltransferase
MSNPSSADAKFLLTDLLRDVSRSFYLTLRLLPGSIRNQIGLAYLLARATDTIADTGAIPVERRLETLQQLRSRILGDDSRPLSLSEVRAQQSSPAERVLLERIEEALILLRATEPTDRQSIQRVLETITSGQELDLRRFGDASESRIVALKTDAELDDYTYRVAGCVGEFWTRTCFRHLSALPGLSENELIEKGIRFGQGLQLVNILRDLPADLRLGRCYLPEDELGNLGLRPADLLDPLNEQRLKPLYDKVLARADAHLATAWSYVLDLPRSWVRVRVACALPVLIGVKTLNKLQGANVLNPYSRIKVSRQDVKQIMRASILFYPVNSVWKNLPARVIRT